MIACSKLTIFLPSSLSTSIWLEAVKRPVPLITVTLRCLARPARPPVSFLTMPSFHSRSLSMSIEGVVKLMPWSAIS